MIRWNERFLTRLENYSVTPPGNDPQRHVVIYQVGLSQNISGSHKYHHIYALCVVERGPAPKINSEFLTKNPLPIPEHKGFSVGVVKHQISLEDFLVVLHRMEQKQKLFLNGQSIKIPGLTFHDEKFIRADSTIRNLENKILCQNFYGGSYVHLYSSATPLTELANLMPEGLPSKGLSETLSQLPHINLSAAPAQIGNVLIQFRELPLAVKTTRSRERSELIVNGAWRSDCPSIDLRLIAVFDDEISAPIDVSGKSWQTKISHFRNFKKFRLDIQERVSDQLIYGIHQTNFIERMLFNTNTRNSGRTEKILIDGKFETVERVSIGQETLIGEPEKPQKIRETKAARAAELADLKKQLAFFSYADGHNKPNHVGAIDDLNRIIEKHGQIGAWIWDPYLNGQDILKTLGRSIYVRNDLRALSDRKLPPTDSTKPKTTNLVDWKEIQVQSLETGLQYMSGVNLQFRVRTGSRGYSFHDRFLILPQKDGEYLAWSLGTSINALGKQHHIIQQVEHAAQIADSFLRLWHDMEKDSNTQVWPKL